MNETHWQPKGYDRHQMVVVDSTAIIALFAPYRRLSPSMDKLPLKEKKLQNWAAQKATRYFLRLIRGKPQSAQSCAHLSPFGLYRTMTI